MIDLVFMMNIYFLVTFVSTVAAEISLPSANNTASLDSDKAIVITILNGTSWQQVQVIIGDGKEAGAPITDPEEQAKAIDAAVRLGVQMGKTDVLVKAEQSVRLGELRRVCDAIDQEDVKLHLAVLEKDSK
jgi:biopolymer transport protein ExbD